MQSLLNPTNAFTMLRNQARSQVLRLGIFWGKDFCFHYMLKIFSGHNTGPECTPRVFGPEHNAKVSCSNSLLSYFFTQAGNPFVHCAWSYQSSRHVAHAKLAGLLFKMPFTHMFLNETASAIGFESQPLHSTNSLYFAQFVTLRGMLISPESLANAISSETVEKTCDG